MNTGFSPTSPILPICRGQVASPGVAEVVEAVALARLAARHPDVDRADPERLQRLRELPRRRLRRLERRRSAGRTTSPARALLDLQQRVEQLVGRERLALRVVVEDGADVGEQVDAVVELVVAAAGQLHGRGDRRLAATPRRRARRPRAAAPTPAPRRGRRASRAGRPRRRGARPASARARPRSIGALAPAFELGDERRRQLARLARAEPLDLVARLLAAHLDRDRAVGDRGRQAADPGERLRGRRPRTRRSPSAAARSAAPSCRAGCRRSGRRGAPRSPRTSC